MEPKKEQLALEIVKHLTENGYQALFAGGYVRDMLLGQGEKGDIDIATNATPTAVATLFPHVIAVGEQFGVMIVVKKGIPVRIILSSQDVTHGFAIDAFKVSASVEKGKDTVVNFTPDKTGTFDYYCSVFCGIGHLGMRGKITVK